MWDSLSLVFRMKWLSLRSLRLSEKAVESVQSKEFLLIRLRLAIRFIDF